jgi:3-methylcrotonyl-CoA carboxylase alpha subunit
LQRRHQKVIEEAPAPGMTEEMRAAMGGAAVRAAEAIGYSGAGTVEFIVDGSEGLRPDRFWFMEMNTRLQVEHPVTELITGVDLVAWQLRVAAGEGLPARQDDLTINGHAFEARLYAEDVPKGFLPATGTLSHLAFPTGCRADSGVRPGDEISPWYDPMIAKVITHGPTRALALRRLARALEETEVAGTVTNLAFLGALARHEGFARGDVDTGLIARDIDALVVVPVAGPREVAWAAMAGLGLLEEGPRDAGFVLWQPLEREVVLIHAGEEIAVRLRTLSASAHDLRVGETWVAARCVDGRWRLDGQPAAPVAVDGARVTVFAQYGLVFDLVDPLAREGAAGGDAALIEAPMPGLVKAVYAEAGQPVAKGDRLAVLEAMKMEHSLLAARDGVVAEVLARAGDQVSAGAALIRLEAGE